MLSLLSCVSATFLRLLLGVTVPIENATDKSLESSVNKIRAMKRNLNEAETPIFKQITQTT